MRLNHVEITVTVKGRPVTEYPHNGQTFIEGREKSQFEINVTNHNPYRIEAIVAVDGLSILDGKDAGPESQGYLLNSGETIAIPGWKLNESQVAAFVFSGKGESYTALSTGSARNTGVIGLLAYRERHVPMHPYQPRQFTNGGVLGAHTMNLSGTQIGGYDVHAAMAVSPTLAPQAMAMGLVHNTLTSGIGAVNNVAMAASVMRSAGPQGPQGSPGPKGDAGDQGPGPFDVARYYSGSNAAAPEAAAVQNLGTAFGEATNFATTAVTFNRGDMQAMVVLYYDNARGLKARGISLTRTRKDAVLAAPNAFPGLSGCVPPAGWSGGH